MKGLTGLIPRSEQQQEATVGLSVAGEQQQQQSPEWELGVKAMQKNLHASLAPSTAAQYKYWWERYTDYCVKVNKEPLDSSGADIAVFLSYTAEVADATGGVAAAKAAIRHNFLLWRPNKANPADSSEVELTLRGLKRRFFKPVTKKTPLTASEFGLMLDTATQGGDFEGVRLSQLRLAAQIAVMYLTFSRYEEAAALTMKQVHKQGHNLVIQFEKGKTYQYGESRTAVMAGQPDKVLNPVRVVLAYMKRLSKTPGNSGGLLFPAVSVSAQGDRALNKAASYNAVLRQFKELVVEAGVATDPAAYGLHSMRRGGVTEAINAGASDHIVMKQMRVSNVQTVQRYATVNTDMLASASAAIFH